MPLPLSLTLCPGWVPGATLTLARAASRVGWAKYENGTTAKGGPIKLIGVMQGSEQGFQNIDHAAKLIRTTRTREGGGWTRDTRAIVLQGSDHRFYVYDALLAPAKTATGVPTETQPLDGAIAIYVFGINWASWREDTPDGNAETVEWRAATDTAIS